MLCFRYCSVFKVQNFYCLQQKFCAGCHVASGGMAKVHEMRQHFIFPQACSPFAGARLGVLFALFNKNGGLERTRTSDLTLIRRAL